MNCSILARNSALEAKLLRRSNLRTRMENQISIWLSQEACLGVKWKTMRCVGSRRNSSRFFLDASTPQGNRIWNSGSGLDDFGVFDEIDSNGVRMIRGPGDYFGSLYRMLGRSGRATDWQCCAARPS